MWRYKSDDDAEYMGNIWGWKFSYISLVIIVVVALIALPRSCKQHKANETPVEQVK